MKKIISDRLAIKILLAILCAVIVFHFLIVFGFVPFDMVWGGRLKNQEEMIRFESVSIAINAFMLTVIIVKSGYLKIGVPAIVITILIWAMVGLFLLNTLGNLLSTNAFEKLFFTPLTLILAILCARVALVKSA